MCSLARLIFLRGPSSEGDFLVVFHDQVADIYAYLCLCVPDCSVPGLHLPLRAILTFTSRDAAGQVLARVDKNLLPGGHDTPNMKDLFGLTSFIGSLEVTSTEPIVTLWLNAEADPVFSSSPPGELD